MIVSRAGPFQSQESVSRASRENFLNSYSKPCCDKQITTELVRGGVSGTIYKAATMGPGASESHCSWLSPGWDIRAICEEETRTVVRGTSGPQCDLSRIQLAGLIVALWWL